MHSRFGGWMPWGGGIVSGLDGPFQTVPRAELLAFALALEHSVSDLRYVTDNMPLLQGWRPAAPWSQP
eukprot:6302389-Pyramimonas_sp.AAC.1